jgi:plasmid stability protein
MADGELTLKIDAALAERLRARAEAVGQTVEEYALAILRRAVEEPGFEDDETRWNGAQVHIVRDDGFSEAYADEIDRICDEAERTGGVPFEVFQERLRNLGQRR